VLSVDATHVSFKLISSLDTAANRAISSQIWLHLISTDNWVVLIDVVLSVGYCVAILYSTFTLRRWWWVAISTHVYISVSSLQIVCCVLHAGAVGNTVIESILVNFGRVTTVTAATSISINYSLSIDTDRGGVLKVIHDVESISKSASSSLSPAWSTVLGNVLVLVPWHVVATIDASPIDLVGKVINWSESVRNDPLTICEFSLLCTASTLLKRLFITIVFRLRHRIDCLIVFGIVLLSLCCCVEICPLMNGCCPGAFWFNSEIVDSSYDFEEAVFAPMGTPRVTDSPVLNTILFPIADDGHFMGYFEIASIVIKNTNGIFMESICGCHGTRERPPLNEFIHNRSFANCRAILINFVFVVVRWNNTCLIWRTITAERHSRASNTVVPASTLINSAGLISNIVCFHPLIGQNRIATMATVILLLTWYH